MLLVTLYDLYRSFAVTGQGAAVVSRSHTTIPGPESRLSPNHRTYNQAMIFPKHRFDDWRGLFFSSDMYLINMKCEGCWSFLRTMTGPKRVII
jgi:hypothetical protein